jgi:hypothetical protein
MSHSTTVPATKGIMSHSATLEKKLLECAEVGEFEQAQQLVEIHRVDVNCVDESGYTPLMKLCVVNSLKLLGCWCNTEPTSRLLPSRATLRWDC